MRRRIAESADYKPRFVNKQEAIELVNLYHLARTALCGKPCSALDRKIWACEQLARKSNSVSRDGAYKDLCGLLGH
jgi:hypothetical protein